MRLGIAQFSRIAPVVTLLVYLGLPAWAGPVAPVKAKDLKTRIGSQSTLPALLRPMLSEKNQLRIINRCDTSQVTYFLSEPGRFASAHQFQEESFRRTAKYAARKILRTKLEDWRPDFIDQWRESAVRLRAKEAYRGEQEADKDAPLDLDVGLRSGRPFVGTQVAGARVTLEHDLRRHKTKLLTVRKFGTVSARFELRHGDDLDERQVRLSFTIPLSW